MKFATCDRFEIEKESREKRGENENKNRFKNRQDFSNSPAILLEMEKSKGEKETNCILHRIDSRSRENRNENREARKRSGILDGEEKRVASGARERWERRQKRRGEGLKGEGTGARGKGRETGAMRLERGGLDVGRPERARTTALGRLSSFFFPSRHRPRGDQRSVQTAPIHKLAYITPLLRSRNERQPIQGSVTRL